MTRFLTRIVLAAAIVGAAAGAPPVEAGGYVGIQVLNHGVSLGFGGSNWGIWGSSWHSGSASFGFSATLAGYGEWVHVGGLGRVWRPWVAAGWQPYSHGRWIWTSMGWTWVAYEPWGWVPHHYGNWAFSTVGWVWSPGYAYHPGNVVWVSAGAHVGWYPSAPMGWSHHNRGYHHGWHNGYATGRRTGYSHGYEDGWRDARYATWVPRSRVTADNVSHHTVGHGVATHAVARSNVTTMSASPSRIEIERHTGRAVPEVRIAERRSTVDGRDVRMVRPEGMEKTVQRHSTSTIERALSPTAREKIVKTSSGPSRRSDTRTPTSQGRSSTISRSADNGERTHPSGTTSRVRTTRSTAVTTPNKVDGRTSRPVVQSAPRSQVRSPVRVSDSRRKAEEPWVDSRTGNRSRTSTTSVSREKPVKHRAPTVVGSTSTGRPETAKQPESARTSTVRRVRSTSTTEAPDPVKEKRRRNKSRN